MSPLRPANRAPKKHMQDKCWEKCDECAEAGVDRCDAAKEEGDCANCRRLGVACTKPSEGQATTGDPREVKATGSGQNQLSQQPQQDASQSAPEPRPRQLLGEREDHAYEVLDDEVAGSDNEEALDKDEKLNKESHDTRSHIPSIQHDSSADVEMVEADQMTVHAEVFEPGLAAEATISSNVTKQPQDNDIPMVDTTQVQSWREDNHLGRSAGKLFLNIETVPPQPRTEGYSTKETARRSAATVLSPVDQAFLSDSHHPFQEQTQTALGKNTRPRMQPLTLDAAPSDGHPPPSAPLAAPTTIPRSTLSEEATATLVRTSSTTSVPLIWNDTNKLQPQPQTPTPLPHNFLPPPTNPSPPWWTSIPEIASMLAAQRRAPAPYGLSNDFTEFYSHVLEATDNLSKKKTQGDK
ncbi:uncharacterized protein N0V89_004562 [Didymosphaeria variabile]|uniref:Uncharacterized protein n=1 Tax=Didymosphaeria variabile TaxID=1932322 RepID=A0A9W9CDC8_9PLEO|nr:uncharacterized protein N0V89_004562 [Didymosphaeria variabile]KAJ4356528.1 hypothetical protein N0V89_004562 [Didymosphaeria variabile]